MYGVTNVMSGVIRGSVAVSGLKNSLVRRSFFMLNNPQLEARVLNIRYRSFIGAFVNGKLLQCQSKTAANDWTLQLIQILQAQGCQPVCSLTWRNP